MDRPTSGTRVRAVILLATFVLTGTATAQRSTATEENSRWISIESNYPDSHVYADSTWLGTAAEQIFRFPIGAKIIRLVAEDADSWSVRPVIYELQESSLAQGSDTLRLRLDFPYYYSLESVPSGAQVFLDNGDSRVNLGLSPLTWQTDSPVSGTFVFAKEGYIRTRIEGGAQIWNRHLASLTRDSAIRAPGADGVSVSEPGGKQWINYVAASAVVVGGILAVHYKTQANNLFDDYSETGDPDLRPRIQALDNRSAAGLIAMQAGITVIVFRLVF